MSQLVYSQWATLTDQNRDTMSKQINNNKHPGPWVPAPVDSPAPKAKGSLLLLLRSGPLAAAAADNTSWQLIAYWLRRTKLEVQCCIITALIVTLPSGPHTHTHMSHDTPSHRQTCAHHIVTWQTKQCWGSQRKKKCWSSCQGRSVCSHIRTTASGCGPHRDSR